MLFLFFTGVPLFAFRRYPIYNAASKKSDMISQPAEGSLLTTDEEKGISFKHFYNFARRLNFFFHFLFVIPSSNALIPSLSDGHPAQAKSTNGIATHTVFGSAEALEIEKKERFSRES